MSDLLALLAAIIPPNDYQHRNGFSNQYLLEKLTPDEHQAVGQALLGMLENSDDPLIGETLAHMKAVDALRALGLDTSELVARKRAQH